MDLHPSPFLVTIFMSKSFLCHKSFVITRSSDVLKYYLFFHRFFWTNLLIYDYITHPSFFYNFFQRLIEFVINYYHQAVFFNKPRKNISSLNSMTYWSDLSSNTGTDKRMNYTIFVKIINLSHQWVMFLLNHFHYSVYFQCQSFIFLSSNFVYSYLTAFFGNEDGSHV